MAWKSIADLIAPTGEVALLGAPMEAGSVTPGRCDLAPSVLRHTLRRFSTYDVESGDSLDVPLQDRGDVPVQYVENVRRYYDLLLWMSDRETLTEYTAPAPEPRSTTG